jgi:hypothetical protein
MVGTCSAISMDGLNMVSEFSIDGWNMISVCVLAIVSSVDAWNMFYVFSAG